MLSIAAIAGGCLLSVQFLLVIIGGIHASELRKGGDNDDSLPLTYVC